MAARWIFGAKTWKKKVTAKLKFKKGDLVEFTYSRASSSRTSVLAMVVSLDRRRESHGCVPVHWGHQWIIIFPDGKKAIVWGNQIKKANDY